MEVHRIDIAYERGIENPDYDVSQACNLIRVRHHKIHIVPLRQAQSRQPDDGKDTLNFYWLGISKDQSGMKCSAYN